MTATTLLDRLGEIGVAVHAEGDKLLLEAPKGVFTADLRKEVAAAKPELLRLLQPAEASTAREIAALLARAYHRALKVACVSGDGRLDVSANQSVHGGAQ